MAPFFLTKDKVEDRDWGRVEASRCRGASYFCLCTWFLLHFVFFTTLRVGLKISA